MSDRAISDRAISDRARVGVVGGRGVVGRELVKLLEAHPRAALVFAASSERPVTPAEAAAAGLDALILAAPNGESEAWVRAVDAEPRAAKAVIVDVSSDHRFDDGWVYGLPELTRERVKGARRIANPGCYATGAQLALAPFLDLLGGAPAVFGVSGYSGAGSKPSPKNDPARLADNLMPYSLVDHTHEREISRHLGRPVAFMPHVAPFWAGISLTVHLPLSKVAAAGAIDASQLLERARARYATEPLLTVSAEPPEVRDARGKHGVRVGGFAVDAARSHAVVVACLDNLLKGAATQAVQNMNLALGLGELEGIPA